MSATLSSARPMPIHNKTNNTTSSLRQTALKKNMSITQTYYLAHKARAKLSREAAQPDHDLRLLVGHANLLDSLMVELADAEREQERWFNQSVRGAASKSRERRVQWADQIVEEEYESDSSDSSDEDYEEEDIEMVGAALQPAPSRAVVHELDDEEDYAQLELVRTPSHSSSSLPELDQDSDSSEDESMPPSPPEQILTLGDEKPAKELEQENDDALYQEDFYLSPRNPGLVTAVSVY